MSEIARACDQVVRLSSKYGVDPHAVVGLMSLRALATVDFARISRWRDVSERLQEQERAADAA